MAKSPKSDNEKREDEILRRMLNTPPKPHRQQKVGDEEKSPRRPRGQSKSKDG